MSPKIRFAIVEKETGRKRYVDFEKCLGLILADGYIKLLDYNQREFLTILDIDGKVKYKKEKGYYKFRIEGFTCDYLFEMSDEGIIWPLIKTQLELLNQKGILEDGN